MIVRITTHTTRGVLVAHTPPAMAELMGKFEPARRSAESGGYLLPAKMLEQFLRFLDFHDVAHVDERTEAKPEVEKFVGPLPECAECGQPASRQAALSLNRCPACGAVWRPVVHNPEQGGLVAPRVECPVCGRRQKAGFAFCGGCGTPAAAAPRGAPRPVLPEVERERLEEPMTVGQVMAEAQLDLDGGEDERDFMERAAGER